MKKPTIYLAGAITGLTLKDMRLWWDTASRKLHAHGFLILNPVNTSLDTDSTTREIVANNMYMIKQSDILLVEMQDRIAPSYGTISEIIYAGMLGKPVIAWGDSSLLGSPWIAEHITHRLPTLSMALDYLVGNYNVTY